MDDRRCSGRILEEYGNNGTTNYIKSKFNDINNVDKSFQYVDNHLFVGNYIGFRDYNNE